VVSVVAGVAKANGTVFPLVVLCTDANGDPENVEEYSVMADS